MYGEKGQTLIELALSIVFLLLILFGIIEFGRYLFYANTANNAARDGVRWAVTHAEVSPGNWCDEVEQHVLDNYENLFSPALTEASITVLIDSESCSQPLNGSGSRVQVRVSTTFQTVAASLIPILSGKAIVGDASMRYEL